MKKFLKDLIATYKNYQALIELKKDNNNIEYENITLRNTMNITRQNKDFNSFYEMYEILKDLPPEIKDWAQDKVFTCKNLKDIEEDRIKILFLKISLAHEQKDLTNRNLEKLKQIESHLSDETLEQVLKGILLKTIKEENIDQLTDSKILTFIEENSFIDIDDLLSMESENRDYYMKEYQENLRVIVLHNYDSIINMKHENFKEFIQVIKRRYPASFSDYQCVQTYDLLESLAKEYGNSDKKVAIFALNAFPNFNSILEDENLPDSLKRLIAKQTENKEAQQLKELAKDYDKFLDVDSFSMQELRYQLILEDRFINSENKKYILMLMNCNDRIEFQNRKRSLIESGIYEKEAIDEVLLREIASSENQALIGEKIKLVLSEEFKSLANKKVILTRMNNVATQKEANEILDITKTLCNEEIEEKEKIALLENMPGREHTIFYEDYSISIFGLSSFKDYDTNGVVEMNKGPIKVLIRANNTCNKS